MPVRKYLKALDKIFLLFVTLSQLNKDTNDLLWLAIVGLTDQYIHQVSSINRLKIILGVIRYCVRFPSLKISRDLAAKGHPEPTRVRAAPRYRELLYYLSAGVIWEAFSTQEFHTCAGMKFNSRIFKDSLSRREHS